MKKLSAVLLIFIILTTCLIFNVSAAPKVGDVLGDVLYSNITAYINGHAIPTSVIQGKTLVAVEDLANYGFDVKWNGTEKTLKVELNKDKAYNPVQVMINNVSSGTAKSKYFYTEIKTYLSGELVESYAVSGVTLIDFNDLGKYGKFTWDGKAREIRIIVSGTKADEKSVMPILAEPAPEPTENIEITVNQTEPVTQSTTEKITQSVTETAKSDSSTVYITETGTKYHREGCRYLNKSQIAISKSDAITRGYESCGVCKP